MELSFDSWAPWLQTEMNTYDVLMCVIVIVWDITCTGMSWTYVFVVFTLLEMKKIQSALLFVTYNTCLCATE